MGTLYLSNVSVPFLIALAVGMTDSNFRSYESINNNSLAPDILKNEA